MRNVGGIGAMGLALAAMLAGTGTGAVADSEAEHYAWRPSGPAAARTDEARLDRRFAPPAGFVRIPAPDKSFAAWLLGLSLKPDGTRVLLYSRAPKWRQDVHAAVIDIDTGTGDLQQCADAVMRLYAEWRFARGDARRIAFNDTGQGKPMPFSRWRQVSGRAQPAARSSGRSARPPTRATARSAATWTQFSSGPGRTRSSASSSRSRMAASRLAM